MNFAINYLTHDVNVQFLVFWKFNQNWEFRGRATIFFDKSEAPVACAETFFYF